MRVNKLREFGKMKPQKVNDIMFKLITVFRGIRLKQTHLRRRRTD